MVLDGQDDAKIQFQAKWHLDKMVCDMWESKNHQRLHDCNPYRTLRPGERRRGHWWEKEEDKEVKYP